MTGGGVPIRDFQAHGSSDPSPLQYVALNIIDTGGEGAWNLQLHLENIEWSS